MLTITSASPTGATRSEGFLGTRVATDLPDPVQALRSATRRLHERLDAGLAVAGEAPSLNDYAFHLAAVRDWQVALAPWLRRTDADLSGLALIAADLAEPGLNGADSGSSTLDLQAVQLADDGSDAFCWGIAYVLEGSRLGGQVLYRRLQARLAPHPLRYLGQRADGAGRWPQTLASLRRHLGSEAACASGCRGAVAAFEMLSARFGLRTPSPVHAHTPSAPVPEPGDRASHA